MNELALFAGAGGGILGGHLLGWRTRCAVEINPYARKVLLARQRDGILPRFPIWDDVRTFDGTQWRGSIDVISGGFPCQDISAAGTGKGIEGERSGLWKEFARIIGEVRPRHVFVENSPMLVSRGLGVVLGDLAALGFDARWGVLGAVHAGAPHRRERIWIVATHPDRELLRQQSELESQRSSETLSPINGNKEPLANTQCNGQQWSSQPERPRALGETSQGEGSAGDSSSISPESCSAGSRERFMADSNGEWEQQPERTNQDEWRWARDSRAQEVADTSCARFEDALCCRLGETEPGSLRPGWWSVEPNMGRVAHGVASRVDRLTALGNGQVPSVAALAWRILTQERGAI